MNMASVSDARSITCTTSTLEEVGCEREKEEEE
jgi:hypothetical protein